MTGRACCDCGEEKPESQFNERRKYCKVCQGLRFKAYRNANLDRIRAKQREWWEAQDPEVRKQRRADSQAALKREVIDHYGAVCSCCGEAEIIFLSIDHVDGGGNEHRRQIGQGGLYHWLKRHGWPDGFDVLCHNCNWAKAHGGCPHKTVRDFLTA